MLVFVLNQAQKANTGKIQTPVYENVREFGISAPKPELRPRAYLLSATVADDYLHDRTDSGEITEIVRPDHGGLRESKVTKALSFLYTLADKTKKFARKPRDAIACVPCRSTTGYASVSR